MADQFSHYFVLPYVCAFLTINGNAKGTVSFQKIQSDLAAGTKAAKLHLCMYFVFYTQTCFYMHNPMS